MAVPFAKGISKIWRIFYYIKNTVLLRCDIYSAETISSGTFLNADIQTRFDRKKQILMSCKDCVTTSMFENRKVTLTFMLVLQTCRRQHSTCVADIIFGGIKKWDI